MLIYEVNLHVDPEVAEPYATWLRGHIHEMLAFDGFVGATWYQLDPDAAGRQHWSVHYRVRTWTHLQAYVDEHAEAMRDEGRRRFEGRFSADRRVLHEREVFEIM